MLLYVNLPSIIKLLLLCSNGDIQTLVRLGAYQSLDIKIRDALTQRSPDFPGVVVCTASDSLGTLLQLVKKRRVHRLVVVEGEVCRFSLLSTPESNALSRRKKSKAERKAVFLA